MSAGSETSGTLFPALPAELAGGPGRSPPEELAPDWPVAGISIPNVGNLVGATGFEGGETRQKTATSGAANDGGSAAVSRALAPSPTPEPPSAPAPVPDGSERPESEWIDAELVALAAAVEALSSGHVRVLAAKLHAELVARAGGVATVTSIASRRCQRAGA